MADTLWQRVRNVFVPDSVKAARQGNERPITLEEQYAATTGTAGSFGANVFGNATGQLGPGPPPMTQPLGGDPRQGYYRPGWNIPSPPGEGRPLNADDLRAMAASNYLARRCIEVRKKEIIGLRWGIVPKVKNRKQYSEIQHKRSPLIAEITKFFEYPAGYPIKNADGTWGRFGVMTKAQWLDMLLEDHFVLDALTIYPELTMGGKLSSLWPIDGSTIKPLLTLSGRTPQPPYPAYEQWLYGRPNVQLRADQLYYMPFNRRATTPYGFSLIEQNLIQLNKVLRYELWVSAYFTDGAMPEGGWEAPLEWSKEQVEAAEDYLNAKLAGNPKALRQFTIFPPGMTWKPLKPFTFDDKLDMALIVETCLAFDVQPQELGILPEGHMGGKGSAEGQEGVTHRKSLRPTVAQLSHLFTNIIERYWGVDDLEFRFFGVMEDDEDEPVNDKERLFAGQVSWDALLEEKGMDPVGIDQPFLVIGPQTVLGVPDIKKIIDGEMSITVVPPNSNQSTSPSVNQAAEGTKPESVPKPEIPSMETTKAATTDHSAVLGAVTSSNSNDPSPDAPSTSEEDDVQDDRPTKKHELEFMAAALLLLTKRKKNPIDQIQPSQWRSATSISMAMRYTPQEIQDLADAIYDLKKASYEQGVKESLAHVGVDADVTLTDLVVQNQLLQDAQMAANQIAETFSRDLESTAQTLIENGVVGDDLKTALEAWEQDRADWKVEQIAQTESAQPYAQGAYDAVAKNGLTVQAWEVSPEQCVCARCQAMVNANPWPASYGETLAKTFPLHPNCVHGITPIFATPPDPKSVVWRG